MIDKDVPGIEIIKAMIEKIDHALKIERVKYESDKMEYKFLLARDNKSCEVSLSRSLLDDLNDYKGSRESKYWLGLEGTLKRRLSIPMQVAELIPFSSDIFLEADQDWEQNSGQNINVHFYENDYEIFQDGLQELYNYLEAQRSELSHLKLRSFPYADDQQYIQEMILFRDEYEGPRNPRHLIRPRMMIEGIDTGIGKDNKS